MLRRHFIINIDSGIPNNEIWYTSFDGNVVTPNAFSIFGANIESNTYENGKGVITFDGSVTNIGGNNFRNCTSLTSITIPNSVKHIGTTAFYNCAFTKDNFINNSTLDAEKNNYWGARVGDIEINGLLIKDDTILVACRPHITSFSIPNSITSIGDNAFYNCASLTSITIPKTVTSIGRDAFYNTGIYKDVSNWENNVLYIDNCLIYATTSGAYAIKENTRLIADYAFFAYLSPTSITIPNSVTSIGASAFDGCSALISIIFKGTIEQWNAISKGNNWNNGVPVTVVNCTDGDVEI